MTLPLTGAGPSGSGAAYAATILAEPSLVSLWRLGEPTGTTAADSKGSNTGTYTNTPTLAQTGALTGDADTAVRFTAAQSEYVHVLDAASLDLGDTFTLEAWVKLASAGIDQAVMSKGTGAYYLRVNASNRLELVKSQTASIVASTTTLSVDGLFHHAVATKTGSTVKLYIDAADVTGVVTNSTCIDNAVFFRIGAESVVSTNTPAEFADSTLDEVAVYNTALSASAIAAHYAAR